MDEIQVSGLPTGTQDQYTDLMSVSHRKASWLTGHTGQPATLKPRFPPLL
jgi:hypothetical protein